MAATSSTRRHVVDLAGDLLEEFRVDGVPRPMHFEPASAIRAGHETRAFGNLERAPAVGAGERQDFDAHGSFLHPSEVAVVLLQSALEIARRFRADPVGESEGLPCASDGLDRDAPCGEYIHRGGAGERARGATGFEVRLGDDVDTSTAQQLVDYLAAPASAEDVGKPWRLRIARFPQASIGLVTWVEWRRKGGESWFEIAKDYEFDGNRPPPRRRARVYWVPVNPGRVVAWPRAGDGPQPLFRIRACSASGPHRRERLGLVPAVERALERARKGKTFRVVEGAAG